MPTQEYTTPWREKQVLTLAKISAYRRKNARMIEALNQTGDEWLRQVADLIEPCGTYVAFTALSSGRQKITAANFCRQRLCAVCAWRRQARFVATTYPALELLQGAGYELVFMTLTVRNVSREDLRQAVDQIAAAFTRLMRSALMAPVAGYIRSIEVTEREGSFHPHIHAVLILPPGYCPIDRAWIAQPDLIGAWRRALRVNYDPNVDLRYLRQTRQGKRPYIEAIKYALKPAALQPAALAAVYYALHGRRLISFGGLVTHLRKALNDPDALIERVELHDQVLAQTVYQLNPHGGVYEIISEIAGEVRQ